MRNFLECLWIFAGVLWILATDKEQRRQYNYYDIGGGEIEK